MIAHIVLFRPKRDVSAETRATFIAALERVSREAPTVRRALVGRSIAVKASNASAFPYAAVIEFDDRQGLQAYLEHPAHALVARLFWLHCDETVILDIDAADARTTDVGFLLNDAGSED